MRVGFKTDLAHFGVSHLGVGFIAFLAMMPARALFGWFGFSQLQATVSAQPIAWQVIEIVLAADLFQYAIHRLFHVVPVLWRFHTVHHSSRELDWLAGSRLHLVDIALVRAMTLLPLQVLGFSKEALVIYIVGVSFHAVWIHTTMRLSFGPLRHLIVTPEFRHWHHSAEPEAVDKNSAAHLPWIDRLFGTAYGPDRWPRRYGIEGDPVPEIWPEQLVWPFRRP